MSPKRKSPDLSTPTAAKRQRITTTQKQALMDNLQLEITERARKLRAQYGLQANDLRARIERRVNRIPVSLRKEKMGDLLEKHNTQQQQPQHAKPASKNTIGQPGKGRNATAVSGEKDSHSARRTRKQSHEGVYSDKENAPTASPVDGGGLKNPKRRANGARGAGPASSRVVSQQDSRILSPKSLNSKTYPHSPLRGGGGGGGSPDKLQNRPVSPLKPSSPLRPAPADSSTSTSRARAANAKPASGKDNRPASQLRGTGSRAAGNTGPRPATRQTDRRLSTSTTSSVASSGTTIVKSSRPATATGVRKPTVTNTASSGGAGKKTAVARNQAPVAAAKKGDTTATTTTTGAKGDTSSGRRALRKRA